MIILRKIATQQFCGVILSDDLVGVRDNDNQVFTVSHEYKPGRIEILYNGQVLTAPTDFEETGSQEITFVYLRPKEETVLKANYVLEACIEDTSNLYFTKLKDTPNDYTSHGNKFVKVKANETGLEFVESSMFYSEFAQLLDTPTTYSGFENYFVKVNDTGDGLVFEPPAGGFIQDGVDNLTNGVSSTAITFSSSFSSPDYVLTVSLENAVDIDPSIYPTLITDKTSSGFTINFSGEIDSTNYYLNWRATSSGSVSSGGGGGGGSFELSEDLTPELSGDLDVGNNAIMLDTTPSGNVLHGYTVGWSGDASDMVVERNDTGFGCPLYMKPNGQWFQCTAASGTTQMPCAALALEEGTGLKKILWKGIIRKGAWSWTSGDLIYISTIEGALANGEPNSGAWSQPVGIAISSDAIRFDPGFNPGYINS